MGKSIHYPFVNFDDPNVIVQNKVIEGLGDGNFAAVFSEIRDHAYLPIYYASFWIDYGISAKDPWIYHGMNLLIHLLNGLLLAVILRRFDCSTWAILGSCAVFLAHPVAIESVVWASGRKDVLSALLMLLAWISWQGSSATKGVSKGLVAAHLFFFLALFAKASVFVFPVLA